MIFGETLDFDCENTTLPGGPSTSRTCRSTRHFRPQLGLQPRRDGIVGTADDVNGSHLYRVTARHPGIRKRQIQLRLLSDTFPSNRVLSWPQGVDIYLNSEPPMMNRW